MFFKDRRLIFNLLLLSLLFSILASTKKLTTAQEGASDAKVWEVTLSPNVPSPNNIPIANSCKQEQQFSVVSKLPYLLFPTGRTMVVPGEQTKGLPVIFAPQGLKPGKQQASIIIACDTCGQSNCQLKQQTLKINLVVTEPRAQTSPSSQTSPAQGQTDLPAPGQRIADWSTRQRVNMEKLVNESGPQISETHAANEISIVAFVKGGAPGVVEFTSLPGDSAMLTVEVKSGRPFTQILKGPREVHIEVKGLPNTARNVEGPVTQQVMFNLPAEFGEKPQIARTSISPLGNPKDFVIDGIGLGYQAVGSVTIDQLTFQSAGNQNYVYNFRALRDFDKWGTEILMMTRAADSRLLGTRVKTGPVELKIDRGTQKNGNWDGRNDGGQISHGNHKVQVRVWKTTSGRNGGDWVVRISQQQVKVQ